jgi:hypothetical protein
MYGTRNLEAVKNLVMDEMGSARLTLISKLLRNFKPLLGRFSVILYEWELTFFTCRTVDRAATCPLRKEKSPGKCPKSAAAFLFGLLRSHAYMGGEIHVAKQAQSKSVCNPGWDMKPSVLRLRRKNRPVPAMKSVRYGRVI